MSTRPATRIDLRAASIMVGLCALWGVQQVASKLAIVQGIPPLFQASARSVVAGSLVLLLLATRRGERGLAMLVRRDGTLGAGALAALTFGVEFVLLFEGLKRTSASQAVVLLYTAVFFTAIGAHLLIPGERLRRVNMIGLLLAFAGVAATMAGGAGHGQATLLGDLLMLGAASLWGATTVILKRSRALMAAPSAKVLAYQLFGSIPILIAACWFSGQADWPEATALAWWSLAYQCVIVAFASYLTWFWLITRYPAGRLAAFSFLTPLFGVLASALFLGDQLTPGLIVGLLGVGIGLRLVNR